MRNQNKGMLPICYQKQQRKLKQSVPIGALKCQIVGEKKFEVHFNNDTMFHCLQI